MVPLKGSYPNGGQEKHLGGKMEATRLRFPTTGGGYWSVRTPVLSSLNTHGESLVDRLGQGSQHCHIA